MNDAAHLHVWVIYCAPKDFPGMFVLRRHTVTSSRSISGNSREIDGGCGGLMRSSFYRMPPDAPAPTHEWYRPRDAELLAYLRTIPEDARAGTRLHIKRGGLLIQAITPADADHVGPQPSR